MLNYYYKDSIESFLQKSTDEILGGIIILDQFATNQEQKGSWRLQIPILKDALQGSKGIIFFEFSIPRMGKRVDVILIIENIVFVVEFKVGESKFHRYNIEQVEDYALELRNFHQPSHSATLVPVLIATEATQTISVLVSKNKHENVFQPVLAGKNDLKAIIENAIAFCTDAQFLDGLRYEQGRYSPTPTIIEAAVSLYNNHSVEEITRNDAEAINLTKTTEAVLKAIEDAKTNSKKVICFITGVPGAGKTLVGLKVATEQLEIEKNSTGVYLSGNAPLVAILQEALTRDKVDREKLQGKKITKGQVKQAVKTFIQIIHHYRDAYLSDLNPPHDHVAIFDEAQRAWNKEQTVKFMRQKKNKPDFDVSEPEFLISCLDRHKDWAVVVCLVGGGQEINTGEAGIGEWLNAIERSFKSWEVHISQNLLNAEYGAQQVIKSLENHGKVQFESSLHLSVSMRSFRAEKLSLFIHQLLGLDATSAKETYLDIKQKYPIVIARNLNKAKAWIKEQARGSERYGLVVSSQAQRLKPLAIDVRTPLDPVHWFLDGKDDVRSSFYMEDAATEFHIQGLELDWACVVWDGDLRHTTEAWQTFSFKGNKWQNIKNAERRKYLINAYRVLLTRARQGMVIVVPEGNDEDHSRKSTYYDSTFRYLRDLGLTEIN